MQTNSVDQENQEQKQSRAAKFLVNTAIPLVIALAVFAVLARFMYPLSTLSDQKAEQIQSQQELQALENEAQQLKLAIARLDTDVEIERVARHEFNLVYPGEEAYGLLPAPQEPLVLPKSWPFNMLPVQEG